MTRFRGSPWMLAASLLALTMLAPPPSPAGAQQRDPTPSAKELWREYPLEATPEAGARSTSSRAPAARAGRRAARAGRRVATAPAEDGGGPGALLLIAAAIATAGAVVGALAWVGWRARRTNALPPVRRPRAAAPVASPAIRSDRPRQLALAASGQAAGTYRDAPLPARGEQARSTGNGDSAARPAAPPDGALEWTAEIEWRHASSGSRFCIMASRAGSSERTAVSESEPLDWPPTGPESLEALRHAVEQLEYAALAAGWRSAPAGRAWYAKRFTWQSGADGGS